MLRKFLLGVTCLVALAATAGESVAVPARTIDPITQAMLDGYDNILRADPSDYTTLYQRAMQYYRLDMADEALADVRNALRLTPASDKELLIKEYELLAYLQSGRGEYAQAVESIDAALKIRPDDFNLLYHKGELCLKAGDVQEARGAFNAMLRRQPRSTEAMLGLARADAATGLADAAIEKMERAEELNSSAWTTYQGIGDIYVMLKMPEAAAISYLKAIALADDRPLPLESLLRLAATDYPAVQKAIATAESASPNTLAMPLLMANVAYTTGHYADAVAALNSVVTREQGRQPGIYSLMAECLTALGRAPEALEYVQRAIDMQPRASYYVVKAGALRAMGRNADALEAALRASQLSSALPSALREQALNLVALDQSQRALNALNQAVALAPADAELLTLRALVASSLPEADRNGVDPAADYAAVIALPATDGMPLAMKVIAQSKSGKFLDADSGIRRFTTSSVPSDLYLAALIYANAGDKEKAREYARKAREAGYENIDLLETATGPLTLRP